MSAILSHFFLPLTGRRARISVGAVSPRVEQPTGNFLGYRGKLNDSAKTAHI